MDWGERLKAAWRGEVSNADLGAMFAATAGLANLKQALSDQRLAADIEHSGYEWRALLAVGRIAAPLWLADALVSLAGAFYDAETQAHPDHSSSISPYTYDLVATLLAPVEDIIADVTAALADPGRRASLSAPLGIGPGRDLAAFAPPVPPPAPYAHGLATGARRVHTSAAAALAEAKATVAKAPAPDWLAAGFRRVDGSLQAAGARLDVVEVRLTPLVGEHGGVSAALTDVCRDLWLVVDTAVVAGQVISDPHLLPEAVAVSRSAEPPATPPSPALPPLPPLGQRTRRVALPQIAEGVPALPAAPEAPRGTPLHVVTTPSPPSRPDLPLPAIGGGPDALARPAPGAPSVDASLPAIGDAAQPPEAGSPPSSHTPRSTPSSQPGAKDAQPDDESGFRLPDIG